MLDVLLNNNPSELSSSDENKTKATTEPASAKSNPSTLQQKLGDASNRWMSRNRSLVLRQTPVWAQGFAGILIGLGSIAFIGACFFRIDEVVTVSGQLQSIGGSVDVETPIGGRIAKTYFTDGSRVNKGELLVQFDTDEAQRTKITAANLLDAEEEQLASRLKILESQKSTINSRLDVLKKRIKTKQFIATEMSELVKEGGFQRIQYLEQLDQLYALKKEQTDLKEQISRYDLQRDQVVLESKKSIEQLRNRLKSAELTLKYQNVKAPASGIVFDPDARVEGVLTPGERILTIVPESGLYAEVFVSNKDIGFVKPGQSAKVRVDAFPFTRYGELDADVTHIGADALEPDQVMQYYRFPVKLRLQSNYLESDGIKIPLKSGMSITTNLKLRDKRVISLISDLLVDQTDSVRSIRQQ